MNLSSSEHFALRIAPLAAPVVFTTIVCLPGVLNGLSGYFEVFLVVTVFGLPVAYIVEFLIGLPVFLLARKYRLANIWSLSLGGAALAMLPFGVLRLHDSGIMLQSENNPWLGFIALGASGFAAGLLFWFVAYYRPQNNRLVRKPGTTRHVS